MSDHDNYAYVNKKKPHTVFRDFFLYIQRPLQVTFSVEYLTGEICIKCHIYNIYNVHYYHDTVAINIQARPASLCYFTAHLF